MRSEWLLIQTIHRIFTRECLISGKSPLRPQQLLRGHQRKLWSVDEWQLNNSLQHLAGENQPAV